MSDWALLVAAGVMLIVLGFFLIAIAAMRSARDEPKEPDRMRKEEEKIKGGGVILIGPIPIVFGSDRRYALVVMVLAIALMLLAIIFLK